MDDGKRDGWEGQWIVESVIVGRESDMQECPPRGSPVCPHRQSCPVCPHRQACPRRDSRCEALKQKMDKHF